ncbi:uncharacterized protein [Chelonus insularis]|uniref:uncharacterized protein n=1 Tax=Chelonus insularis TaxID=460826 RepID=UPI00158B7F7E|nr:uncharacterized protein LOC118068145 [Chelonus insularis]
MNINLLIAVTIIYTANQLLNTEAELSIVSYDVTCPKADPVYFRDIEVYIEDEGKDNEFFINFTLIKKLPAEATHTLKMIGASMGEFVVATGIDFTITLCEAFTEPIFGERMYRQLGLNVDECPAVPGVYGGSHINLVDKDSLPDTFPPNDYKMIVSAQVEEHILFECWTFFKIQ